MKKNTSWGGVAKWYDSLLEKDSDSFQQNVILPHLTRLLDLRPSETVLDIACGQGFFSRIFAAKAKAVIGCDISSELVSLAQKHNTKKVAYHVSSADDLRFCADRSVDAAVIVLALQNIKNVDGVFKECARVLTERGRLAIVLNHPAFRGPKISSWGWDEAAKVQYRRMDEYLSEVQTEIDMHPGKKQSEKTVSFHRPLQWYMKMLAKHNFAVTKCEEWISHREPTRGPRFAAEDKARKEFPLFLFLEGKKIS